MPNRIPYHKAISAAKGNEDARAYRQSPGRKEVEAFYNSKEWRRHSRAYRSEHPLCEPCQREGRVTAAQQVHHKEEISKRPDLAYEWDNLESVCIQCHNEMRKRST